MTTGSSPTQPGSRVGALKYQTAHGFRRGQPVYGASTGVYKLATIATGFDGVVGSINSPNQFELVTAGSLDNISGILSQGQTLYLSTVPGAYALTGDTPVLKGQSTSAANVQALAPPTVSSSTTSTTSTTGFTSASNSGSGAPVFNAATSTATALKFKTITQSGAAVITDNGASLDFYAPPASGGSSLPSYKATVLAESSLVSLWTFDDAFGSTTCVDSKGSNPLTATAPSTPGGMSALGSAAGGSLMMIAGAPSPAGGSTGLPVNNAARSIELWFATTLATQESVFHYGQPSFTTDTFDIGFNANSGGLAAGAIDVYFGSAPQITSQNVLIYDGHWHHLVVTYDGAGNLLVWLDGKVVAQTTGITLTTTYNPSYPMTVGGGPIFGANFVGRMDEVAVYNAALTPVQVALHYYLGRASSTP